MSLTGEVDPKDSPNSIRPAGGAFVGLGAAPTLHPTKPTIATGDAPPFVDVIGTLSLDGPGEPSTILEFEPGTYAAACVALPDSGVASYLTGGPLEVLAH